MSNKTGIGWRFKALTEVNDYSKPNWIWFGIFMRLTMVINFFQTNLNLVWNLRLAKSQFFFPNQTGIGLENPMHFLGVSFPNQTGVGLEKDTEWNVPQCTLHPWIDSLVDWMNFRFRLSLFSSQMVGLCEFSPCCPQRFMSVLSSWDPRFLDPNIYATTTSVLKSQNTIGNLGNRYECHHLSNTRFPDMRSCILCHILLQPAFNYSWVGICGLGVSVP